MGNKRGIDCSDKHWEVRSCSERSQMRRQSLTDLAEMLQDNTSESCYKSLFLLVCGSAKPIASSPIYITAGYRVHQESIEKPIMHHVTV
jgi:hypothetical protein